MIQRKNTAEILVIEDSESSMLLLTELLEENGYGVRQAQDGEMALSTVKIRAPDLVLLDINLPDFNGFIVCRKMKMLASMKDVPVLFCSALDDPEIKVHGFSEGGVDYITKPYNPDEVLIRVKTHLELSRLRNKLEHRVKQRTRKLRETKQELKLAAKAFEASPNAIMITDPEHKIVSINPAFTRVLGYSKSDSIGKTPESLLFSGKHDKDFVTTAHQKLEKTGHWSGEVWHRCENGNVIPVMEEIHEFRDRNDKLTHYVRTVIDLSESKDAQTIISFLAHHDGLTGLANRIYARQHFEKLRLEADRSNKNIAILYLDLDRFKVINDSLGHSVGDQVLRNIASQINSRLNSSYLLSRDSGDEFMIISDCFIDIDEPLNLARQLTREKGNELIIDEHKLLVQSSIGISIYPDHGKTFNDLLKHAENALYSTKRSGGQNFSLFEPRMDKEACERMNMEIHLRNAVKDGECKLMYQPKISLLSGEVVGAEALVRWNSPVLGYISPAQFIPLAEETGIILDIDEWVIRTACEQINHWKAQGLAEQNISVNLSALQFRRGDLNRIINTTLQETGVSASSLELEITEGILMENMHIAVSILKALKHTGVRVSLDDFGTGYSSLHYLKKLPIDTLKIDKSFIDKLHIEEDDAMIVKTIIALGHNLGLNVVAEGVENAKQNNFLRDNGCDEIQGYYYSKPLDAKEYFEYINSIYQIQAEAI